MFHGFLKLSAAFMVVAVVCQRAAGQGSVDSPFAGTYVGSSTGTAQTPNGEFGETGEFTVTVSAGGTVSATGTVTRNINGEPAGSVGFTATGTVTNTGSANLSGTAGSGQAACPFTFTGSFSLVGPDKVGGGVYDSNCGGGVTSQGEWSCETLDDPAALQFIWDEPAGGPWNTGSNWDRGSVPGPQDDALVNLTNALTIAMGGAQARRLSVQNTDLTLESPGQLLGGSPTGPSVAVGSSGKLRIKEGNLRLVDATVVNGLLAVRPQASLTASGGVVVVGTELTILDVEDGDLDCAALTVGGANEPDKSLALFSGLSVNSTADVVVGVTGQGGLFVVAGAELTSKNAIIGGSAGDAGTAQVKDSPLSGIFSQWNVDTLSVGRLGGRGVLEVLSGGFVNAKDARVGLGLLKIAGEENGQAAELNSATDLRVGSPLGASEVLVEDGGFLSVPDELLIADTGAATVTIRGISAALTRSELQATIIEVGSPAGVGELVVEDGAKLSVDTEGQALLIRVGTTGQGFMFVRGVASGSDGPKGATVTAGAVSVGGANARGRIEVTNGGFFDSSELTLGQFSGGSGTVVVRDENVDGGLHAEWHVTRLIIGGLGSGDVEIGQGGVAAVDELTLGTADAAAAEETAVLSVSGDGTNSTAGGFICNTAAQVQGRSAHMTVAGGGLATFFQGLSITPTGEAEVEVTGGESKLQVDGVLKVAGANGDAQASLNLRNGAALRHLISRLTLVVGDAQGGSGSLLLDNSTRTGLTSVAAANVDIQHGRATVAPQCRITSAESIVLGDAAESALALISDNIDDILVECQSLRVGPEGTVRMCPFGRIEVSVSTTFVAGSRLEGAGIITSQVFSMSGTHGIGCSPGTLEIRGDYQMGETAVLEIEVAGLDAGQFDVLKVTGKATLAGTLELRFIDGFLPKQGDTIEFVQADGGLNGQFKTAAFPNLAPGFAAEVQIGSDGRVKLTALNDAAAGAGTSLDPSPPAVPPPSTGLPLPAGCGIGVCGAGATPMVALAVFCMSVMRRRRVQAVQVTKG